MKRIVSVKNTVVVGVSGGVDSAVCAAILIEQGFNVTGVFLDVGGDPSPAEEVCRTLDIPFVVVKARDELERLVIKPFVENYLKCQTPNPCVICNPMVKYPMLMSAAEKTGAAYISTGHYAGIVERDGIYYLKKGHPERDQSYMLYRLPQEILSRCMYPIGNMPKSEIRKIAAGLGLAAANAPDSMEICFVPNDDYAAFVRSRGGDNMPEGDIVDTNGNVLGHHKGLYIYTVGQRRGLGVSSAGRLFVVSLDAEKNQVILGDKTLLYKDEIQLRDVVWSGERSISDEEFVDVKIRHSRVSYKAVVKDNTVRFLCRISAAATPGQSAVFYRDDIVLGGGIIC